MDLFIAAYPGEVSGAAEVDYVKAANAIAAYEDRAFRAIDSPFDRYLKNSVWIVCRRVSPGSS
ncbi:cytochrome-c peroxidase [Candidatus Thiodictyon syntrophicum]|uniref:cytochrome-c peroxidase n=1 Tax=Candidatus Thiodictyon syntrophicum TaxID=1166950 RepID=UPI001F2FF00D|nr:cytochrome-c peroxidase [Candidatus Thiodictyon syntrophicum]